MPNQNGILSLRLLRGARIRRSVDHEEGIKRYANYDQWDEVLHIASGGKRWRADECDDD